MTKDIILNPGYLFTLLLTSTILCFAPSANFAAVPDFCSSSSTTEIVLDTIHGLKEPCTIDGNLRITTGGRLVVDYTDNPENTLSIEGNIELEGDGILFVKGGILHVSQDYNMQRTITLEDNSIFAIKEGELKTNDDQPDTANKYMNLNAYGNSRMVVSNSILDHESSWLLGNFFDQSQLIAMQSERVPTEVYIRDSSKINIYGNKTKLGVWMDLADGVSGTIDLPDQTDGENFVPYSWTVGRDTGNLTGVDWQLTIHNARVGLAIESHKNSSVTINGTGLPTTGELTIGYYVEEGTEILDGLAVGVQNVILGSQSPDPPQLTLNNTNLGPVAWQIYVLESGTAEITNSVINEVATINGTVDIQDSELQLAVIGSFGPSASMTIANTDIHSQSIEANHGGVITIQESNVYGSQLRAGNNNSSISVERGEFLLNEPPLDSSCSMDNALSIEDGGITCNPFLPENAPVTRSQNSSNLITCDLTTNCSWTP